MWIFGALVLGLAVALAVTAGRPEIAVAAGAGVLLAVVVVMLVRRVRRPATGPRPRRRRRAVIWALAVAAVGLVLAGLASSLYVSKMGNNSAGPPGAVARELVAYHGSGRIEGDQLVIDETVVLSEQVISRHSPKTETPAGEVAAEPEITVSGWQEAGLVDGAPSFERSRSLPWDHSSIMVNTASVPLSIGSLRVSAGGESSSATLTPQNGSRIEIVLPKGSLGTAVPAPSSVTDAPTRERQEIVNFLIDPYVVDVSFDLLDAPFRNPAGRALYNVSLWGIWQWALGAGATAIGGFLVDKVVEAIWRRLSRRARSVLRRRGVGEAA